MRARAEAGFTLVEMMVSLLIFGLLAAAGVALLAFSVRAQAATDSKLADIAALNRLGSALSSDLAQAETRATRNQAGDTLPVFEGATGSGEAPMLRFVRGGWTNIDAAPRSTEQKVEYQLANGVLQRVAYPMLDGAKALEPASILKDVSQITLRYRFDGSWSDRWQSTPEQPLPQALEVRLMRKDGTQFRELFLVGTNYRTDDRLPGGANAAG